MLRQIGISSSVIEYMRASSAYGSDYINKNYSDLLVISLEDPYSRNLLLRSISGISAGGSDLKMTDYASLPGSTYNGSRQPSRNIVMDMVLTDLHQNNTAAGYIERTIENGRQALQLIFPVGKEIELYFWESGQQCRVIYGVVESNEIDVFDSTVNGLPVQVSIVCSDPRFYNRESTIVISKKANSQGFTFPAHMSPFTTAAGYLDSESVFTITYDGSYEQGLGFSFIFKQPIRKLVITKEPRGNMTSYEHPYLLIEGQETIAESGDQLSIDTRPGYKSITLVRNSVKYNYLNYLDQINSTWLDLTPGNNTFVVKVDNRQQNNAYDIQVEYRKIYWGI